ncbi:TlpA family protein disulfide reductase [Streptomyces sp. NPDC019890]|uniref:TlpA family protein disulfide reductase n=1 Tax=Streptomyces sp. NPDC019890 TaxID=3365064 RepID=UPI00384E11E8
MKRITWPVVVAALAVSLAACVGGEERAGERVEGGTKKIAAGHRQQAADIEGRTPGGEPVRLSDFRGKVVVINAWASWCGPCRAETPGLQRLHKELGGQGLQVLGVNGEDDAAAAQAFLGEYKVTYPTLMDEGGRQMLRMPKGLVSQLGLPYTLVVDRDGKVAAAHGGAINEAELKGLVTPLLKP